MNCSNAILRVASFVLIVANLAAASSAPGAEKKNPPEDAQAQAVSTDPPSTNPVDGIIPPLPVIPPKAVTGLGNAPYSAREPSVCA